MSPPQKAIDAAIVAGRSSPCAKSKRGVAIFAEHAEGQVVIYSTGYNAQPHPFSCDGSPACNAVCRDLCEHAEAAALRKLGGFSLPNQGLQLLHLKLVDGEPITSGPPSCVHCSLRILADGRIGRVWLLREAGWQPYSPVGFHVRSLDSAGRPIVLALHPEGD